MKNFTTKIQTNTRKKWHIIDADGKILGRLASKVAILLQGKNKIEYAPHVDMGDYIIILNVSKIIVTGKKRKNKIYYHHTGYSGGIKKINFEKMIVLNPRKIFQNAIQGMLPKGPLGRAMYRKCKIYKNNIHFHQAQNPTILNI